jgi:hypothetical protein
MTIGYRLSVIGYVCGGVLQDAATALALDLYDVEIMCYFDRFVKRGIAGEQEQGVSQIGQTSARFTGDARHRRGQPRQVFRPHQHLPGPAVSAGRVALLDGRRVQEAQPCRPA